MLFKEYYFTFMESLDRPYKWKFNFKTSDVVNDWDDTGEEYSKEVLDPVQIIHFTTDKNIPYIWYARQNRYDDTAWEIAFGINKHRSENGELSLDISKNNSGDAFRVFATILDITNFFIEQDENYEIRTINISSKEDNRTSLYKRYLIPKINNFEISSTRKEYNGETLITLSRTN